MTYVLKYISDFNDRGLELKDDDLLLLLFIFEAKISKQTQLFDFATLLPVAPIKNYDSFCRRLKKWEAEGLIKRKKYGLLTGKTIHTYLIEIEFKGLALLYLAGLLDDFVKHRSVSQKNIEHHIGIVETILQMFRVFSKTDGIVMGVNVVSEQPFSHPFIFNPFLFLRQFNLPAVHFMKKKEPLKVYKNDLKNVKAKFDKDLESGPLKEAILLSKPFLLNSYSHMFSYLKDRKLPQNFIKELWPDWIFKNQNHTYCIEIDANTERNSTLLAKIKKYIELSKKDPNQHYTMFFIMLDDSLKMRKMFDREDVTERLAHLKKEFCINGLHDKENKNISLRDAPNNLEVYVIPLERMDSVLERSVHAVFDNASNSRINKYSNISEIRKNYRKHLIANSIPVKLLTESEIHSREWFVPEPNTTLAYPEPKVGLDYGTDEVLTLFPYVIREGAIKTMDEISYLAEKLEKKEGTVKNAKILAIYEFEDELINDIKSEDFLTGIQNDTIQVYCAETKRIYKQFELI